MDLLDSHAHLDRESFGPDLESVIDRAWQTGLSQIITVGLEHSGSGGAAEAVALAEREARIFATVGVHPHDASLGITWGGDPRAPVDPALQAVWEPARERALGRLAKLAAHPRVVAIGEVGLDYHYDHSPREWQRTFFCSAVELAVRLGKPLVIHTREADEDTLRIMEEAGARRAGGVIHCFTGSAALTRAGLEMGFHFGITGPVTFPKAAELRAAIRAIPLERLLVETDCPYLAPVPHRGRRNEPAYVIEVVRALGKLFGRPAEEIAAITARNARRLFGMPGA